ncbi:MAG: hypothetical protein J6Y74_04365 [Clostridia bacterium]|nr:hypothetical protein [Clostridia bacterium]
MKKVLIVISVLILALFVLAACGTKGSASFGSNHIDYSVVDGVIGDFSASLPISEYETYVMPKFSWTEAANAETYELEIASSAEFSEEDTVYLLKTGITTTEYTLGATLKKSLKKDEEGNDLPYYWRVYAVNKDYRKLFTNEVMTFYYKADVKDEIEMDVIYADEWKVHEVGSQAEVSVDRSDFFDTGKDSLALSFVSEETNQGEGFEESDGWIVLTHSEEMEVSGVDAFYFNFYYAGEDAEVYFRVVDEDNEYWHAPIKLANNAKQTIIIRFDEFTLRTKGMLNVANQVFDYNYLKSFELVFEHSFGDGLALFSDLRLINYEKYEKLFIKSFDFNKYKEGIGFENYVFDTSVSQDGSAFTYGFSGVPNEKNATKIQGYGYVKIPLYTEDDPELDFKVNGALLGAGDAFSLKITLNDNHLSGDHLISIRLIEEDTDRWIYQQRVGSIPASGELIVPFSAFTMSYFGGDGFRQFYGVKELQLGVDGGVYTTSSVTISDLKVVSLATALGTEEEPYVLYQNPVGDDGLIENFDSYKNSVDTYYKWQISTTNKDEAMGIDEMGGIGVKNTVGKFYYKTNMGEAVYTTYVGGINKDLAEDEKGYNAIEILVKDCSVTEVEMDNGSKQKVSVNADMTVYITTDTGTEYCFTALSIPKKWYYYRIPFSVMELAAGSRGLASFDPQHIASIGIAFSDVVNQFTQFDKNFVTGSYVAVDTVRFIYTTSEGATRLLAEEQIATSASGLTVIDTFDTLKWAAKSGQEAYVDPSVADVGVAADGKSGAFPYKTRMSSSYYTIFSLSENAAATGIRLRMKSEAEHDYLPSADIVLYLQKDGKEYRYQAKFTADEKTASIFDIGKEWTDYTIGLDQFKLDGEGKAITVELVPYIRQLSIVLKDYKNAPSDTYLSGTVYIDEIVLDKSIARDANQRASV